MTDGTIRGLGHALGYRTPCQKCDGFEDGRGQSISVRPVDARSMVDVAAIERCAYCREYVPVTRVIVQPEDELRAELSICEDCRHSGR